MWDRTRPNFCKPRAQWPGRNRTQALLILRAGTSALTNQERVPVMGSGADSPCQGEMARRAREGRASEYERGALILSEPRGRFAFFFAMEKEGRRPGHGPVEQKSYLWRRNWEHFGPARRGRRALQIKKQTRREGHAPPLQR